MELVIISGNSNRDLAEEVADHIGRKLLDAKVNRFSDGEVQVEILENVRGKDVFLIQSTYSNDYIMELLVLLDALKRASAGRVVAVIPYYGYGRQDRKVAPRAPISAKLMADLITVAGASRVLSIDLHAGQIQGFFNIPFDHLYAAPVFLNDIKKRVGDDIVIIAPDAGGVERARAYSKRLGCPLAIIDKRRPKPNESKIMNLIGDVKGKKAIILDDLIDTAGTVTQAVDLLYEKGATEVFAYCVHPVLSGPAIERIENSNMKALVVSNTIPLRGAAKECSKIIQLSLADLIAKAIINIHNNYSVSSLFV